MLANEIRKWKASYGTKVYSFENNSLHKWNQYQLKRDEVHTYVTVTEQWCLQIYLENGSSGLKNS